MSNGGKKGNPGGPGGPKFTLDSPPPAAQPGKAAPAPSSGTPAPSSKPAASQPPGKLDAGASGAIVTTSTTAGPTPTAMPASSTTGTPPSSSTPAPTTGAQGGSGASSRAATGVPKPTGAASIASRRTSKRPEAAAPSSSTSRQGASSSGRRLSQHNRLFWIETPFGADKVLIRSLRGREEMSGLFHFRLDLVSEDDNLDFDQIIGRNITFSIKQSDEVTERYFNAHVASFRQLPSEGRLAIYEAEAVPWTWFLTKTTNCLIFQNKNVVQVVEDIFRRLGFQNFDTRQLRENYTPWEYCTQYRETAFNFISRLLEAEGIFTFFKQEKGKHTLVLGDSPAIHKPCPFQAEFRLERAFGEGAMHTEDTIFAWERRRQFRSARYTHTEYNFEIPSSNLRVEKSTRVRRSGSGDYELYDYPGEYEVRPDGDFWGKLRMEEEETGHDEARGESNCRSMMPGFRFTMQENTRKDQDGDYIVTRVEHEGREGGFFSGINSGRVYYRNHFEAIPYPSQFRPERKSSKPVMRGTQTATVTGPKGEEIYVDKYGRVKVQFHWDREGKKDENSSCWIRVSQPWAGERWGAIWIPRIGQEVVVDFLEGDPDRPLITGRVYNAEQMPPYKLPDNATASGFKSRSSKGGGPDNYNEIYFEDKKGDELFRMHAERDMEITVEHDTRETVEHDRRLLVTRHQSEAVGGDKQMAVKGEFRESVGGDVSRITGGKEHVSVGGDVVIESGGSIHLKAASQIVLEAGAGIVFIGGGGFISVNSAGIDIEGTFVDINSGLGMPTGALSALPGVPSIPGLSGMTGALGGLGGALGGLGGAAGGLGGALGGAMGGLGGAMGGLGGAMGGLGGAMGGLGGAMGGLGGAMGGLGGAMGGLGGAMGGLGGALGGALGQAAQGLAGAAQGVLGQLTGSLGQAAQGLANAAQGLGGQLGSALGGVAQSLAGAAQGLSGQLGGALGQAAQGLAGQVQGAIGQASQALNNAAQGLSGQISEAVNQAAQGLAGAAQGQSGPLGEGLAQAAQGLTGAAQSLAGALSGSLGQAAQGLAGMAQAPAGQGQAAGIESAIGQAAQGFAGAQENIAGALSQAFTQVSQGFQQAAQGVPGAPAGGFSQAAQGMAGAAQSLAGPVAAGLGQAAQSLGGAAQQAQAGPRTAVPGGNL